MFGIEYDDGTQRRVRTTPSGFRSSSRFVPQGCAPLENSRRSTPGYVRAVPLGLAPVSLVRWRFMRLSTRRSNSQRSAEKRTIESWQTLIDTKCGSYFMSGATADSHERHQSKSQMEIRKLVPPRTRLRRRVNRIRRVYATEYLQNCQFAFAFGRRLI